MLDAALDLLEPRSDLLGDRQDDLRMRGENLAYCLTPELPDQGRANRLRVAFSPPTREDGELTEYLSRVDVSRRRFRARGGHAVDPREAALEEIHQMRMQCRGEDHLAGAVLALNRLPAQPLGLRAGEFAQPIEMVQLPEVLHEPR